MATRSTATRLSAAALLLVIANLSLWAWLTLLRTDTFIDETSRVLQEERPRAALASLIVDNLLAERPLLQVVLGDTAKGVLDDVLARPDLDAVFSRVAAQMHQSLIASGRVDVTLDAATLEELVRAVAGISGRLPSLAIGAVVPESGIVLFRGDDVPNIHRAAVAIPWVCTLCWLAGLGLAAWGIFRAPDRSRAVVWFGLLLVGVAIVSALMSLPLRGSALVRFAGRDERVIVDVLLDRYIARLYLQTGALLLLGLAIAVAGWVLPGAGRKLAGSAATGQTPTGPTA